MKKLAFILVALWLLSVMFCHAQTNVIFGYVGDYTGQPPGTRYNITVKLLAPNPRWNGVTITRVDQMPVALNLTNGYFSITNLLCGYYQWNISGVNGTTFYKWVYPTTLGRVSLGSLDNGDPSLTPPNPSTNYYTQAQIDATLETIGTNYDIAGAAAAVQVSILNGQTNGTTPFNLQSASGLPESGVVNLTADLAAKVGTNDSRYLMALTNAAAFDAAGVGATKSQQATNGLPSGIWNLGTAASANTNWFLGTNSVVTETSGASGISVDATGKATFSIRTNISSGGGVTTNNVIGIVNSGQTAAVTNLFGVTNLYVYPFGTANGVRGSTTKPFGLLSQAVSNSVAGDTIFVMPGVYNETNHLISWQATPTNLSIYGIGLPEIDFGYGITNSSDPARGSPQKDYIQFRTGLLIDGLKLLCKTAVTNPGGGAAPYCSIGSTFDVPACSGVVIRNCYILGMSDCIFIDSTNSSEGLVDNCDLDGAWDCFTINRLASANQSWTIKNSRLYTTNFLYDIIGGIAQRRCLQVAQGTVSVIGTKFSYRSDRSNHEGVALHVDDPGQIVADGIILDPQGTNATYDLQGVYNGDNLVGLQLGSYAKTSFDQSLSFDPSSSPTFLIGGGTHYGEFVLLNRPIFDSDAGAWITSQWHFKDCATTNGAIKIINENNLLSAVESSITITPMNDNIGATVGTFNLTNIEMQVDAGLSKTTPNGTRVYLHLSNPVGTNSTATWTTTP